MNHKFLITTLTLTVCIAADAGGIKASERTAHNVPDPWTDAHICSREGAPADSARVVIGVERNGQADERFVLMLDRPGGPLPGYLADQPIPLTDSVMVLPTRVKAGYEDDWFEVFVLPNGVRLSCEPIADR